MPRASTKPLDGVPDSLPIPARRGNLLPPKGKSLGGNTYADKTLAPLFSQPIGKKQEKTRDTWANSALVLAMRAKTAAQTYGKKDFNALYRLVLSAGIAFDKAFPQVQQPSGNNLVIQLFGSLGTDTARKILEPARPILAQATASTQDTSQVSDLAAELHSGAVRGGNIEDAVIMDGSSEPEGERHLDDPTYLDVPSIKPLDDNP